MKHGSLFSGIGGFDLAAQWMGWENIFHCEWNPFGQKVLKHYWPNAITYHDITKTDFTIHRGTIDILTGGFPCQPYSAAGKRLGKEDNRHLWPSMCRAIREIQPTYVVGENVRGLTNWNGGMVFDEVQADLETQGYEVTPFLLPACAVNAPHRRDRVWFVAYSQSNGGGRVRNSADGRESVCEGERVRLWNQFNNDGEQRTTTNPDLSTTGSSGKSGSIESNRSRNNDEQKQRGEQTKLNTGSSELLWDATDTNGRRQSREEHGQKESGRFTETSLPNDWDNFPTQSPICNGDDGLSSRLDGITFPKWRNESIKAGGNAIVPQVAYEIFKAIDKSLQHDNA